MRTGGRETYGSLSEQYWRADIPDEVAVDSEGNIYVIGFSEFVPGVTSNALVSYGKNGIFRYAQPVPLLGRANIALHNGHIVVLGLTIKTMSADREAQLLRYRCSDGKPSGKIKLGLFRQPRDITVLDDRKIGVLLAGGPSQDEAAFFYKPHTINVRTSWQLLTFDSALRPVSKREFDVAKTQVRGSALLRTDGSVITIDGLSDGSDHLTLWDPKRRWRVPLVSAKLEYSYGDGKIGTRLHDRFDSPLASITTRVFIGGGPSTIGGVQSFSVADGTPKDIYLHAGNMHVKALAVSNGLLAGAGSIGPGDPKASDAWAGYWQLSSN